MKTRTSKADKQQSGTEQLDSQRSAVTQADTTSGNQIPPSQPEQKHLDQI